MKPHTRKKEKRTQLGREIEEGFRQIAAHLRGELELDGYKVSDVEFTPARIKAIRRKVANSTKEFERVFGIPARTMQSYEQGRRRLDGAMQALLRIIEREPEAARRALAA